MTKAFLPYEEIDIPISREEYVHHQRHLINGLEYDGACDFETVDFFDVDVEEDFNFTLYIRNNPTDEGGPYLDPVLYRKHYKDNGDYELHEDCTGEPFYNLDGTISFIVNNKEYNFAICVVDEKEKQNE